ncbi:MAG: hypothetical protein LC792_02730 [Actinobacteria bacterium]|nr:hypothetical protein [Actinomycetota bacterium]
MRPGTDPDDPAAMLAAWLDDDHLQRIQVAVDVACGPGIELVAAEVLLAVNQTLNRQGLIPVATALRITASPRQR